MMKTLQQHAQEHDKAIITAIEKTGVYQTSVEGEAISLLPEDVEIIPVDIPGWKVASHNGITVALDITISEPLKEEGIARELVNRIQNIRKEKDLEVTDRISLKIKQHDKINNAIKNNLDYICAETLASSLEIVNELNVSAGTLVEVDDEIQTFIAVSKLNN